MKFDDVCRDTKYTDMYIQYVFACKKCTSCIALGHLQVVALYSRDVDLHTVCDAGCVLFLCSLARDMHSRLQHRLRLAILQARVSTFIVFKRYYHLTCSILPKLQLLLICSRYAHVCYNYHKSKADAICEICAQR